ncbi:MULTISPECIES: 1,6-anhydro-N-acetylmuramyl-L-alanine amidase AmpD [Cysteiniphilum]|uniref:1,6-anhydro-N-acetylmuramyl-L-alanine amidase AmpD n=1 Tax=Cysteiniphilum litorale TaxID=2056700 RepID=A0A8J2Z2Q6_9GAMM|nr:MULTISPECIES: 1,6-anhydro-N-acetylmuramyl-L-alanine amidase AmpD [Cysteiniphilum]GGF88108.1 N-acetyl-anhydromuranmyl-L-alanine amidase [Cysteiniphilum litorale]
MLQLDANGWLNKAKIIKSPNFNARPDNIAIDLLVIHCISLPEGWYDNHYVESLFLNDLDCNLEPSFKDLINLKVSSHFYITRQGEIIQFVATEDRAWHAGVSIYKGKNNCNDFSIGIELQGTDKTAFTKAQYTNLIELTKALIKRYPTIKANIVGHSDIAPVRKTDPGREFNWEYFLSNVD